MKRGSIVQWLTLLMLGSGAVAWALSLALVLALPAPPILGASLSQVSALLKGADLTNAHLDRSIRQQAPIPSRSSSPTPMSPMESAIAARLSQDLGGREVRAAVSSFFLPTNRGASPPAIPEAIQDLSLITVDGQFAVANPDGSWTVVEHVRPAVTSWHLQIIGAFLAFGLALVPIAFLLARRLARPLRAIASAAGSLTLGRAQSFPVPDGPKELRQVSEALSQMSQRLRREMEERLFMLSAVAHDLRTPLTALRVRCESAEGRQRERMIGDVERMEQMIGQFLAFTGGAGSSNSGEVNDLAAMAEEAAEDAREAGASVDFSGNLGAFVRVGEVDLRRIIGNLVDNAVRHGEHVEIAVKQVGEHVLLTVGDDGPGLPVEEMERVFEPFYRSDAARGSAEGGAGLGLAIVRMMARANGGEAQLRPRHPAGLEAEVRLPRSHIKLDAR
jgi:signal transduction histidine kinase